MSHRNDTFGGAPTVHFNALLLVYCGALEVAVYGLLALASEVHDVRYWFDEHVPYRFGGGIAMGSAALFGVLWLSQVVPALVGGHDPVGLDEAGLPTNPAHVWMLTAMRPSPGGRAVLRLRAA